MIYTADWILPVSDAPLRRAWVRVEDGRIAGVGEGSPADAVDLGRAVILPGLVNTHTHLELAYLQNRIPPAASFGAWVRRVMETRRRYPDAADPVIVEAARAAIVQAMAAGTALIGDISNTLVTVPLLREAGVPAHVFHELTGFTEQDPEARVGEARRRADEAAVNSRLRVSLAPHAPYSVSAPLFEAIRRDIDAHAGAISSVHLGENPEEVELLLHGTGEIRRVLEDLGRWPADWQPPRLSPVAYLAELGFLDRRVIAVHGVQFDGDDLARLRTLGVTIASCPRSNSHVGVGPPPLEAFYAMDVDVAFGTDSRASVADMNLFAELHEARRIAPRVTARRLLESATLVGARALGFGDALGSIEPGKQAALVAVRVPDGVDDVEEYLVSGIGPDDVQWL